ncbi:MAG: type IV pilus assembly protein PilM [Actinomycetota bacterium]|nr:type IV pilus assembly protein PilM [Actinomycetota bacterium]
MGIFSFGKGLASIGLDIGTNTFRVAQLKSISGSPTLVNYGSIKIPVGAVVEGEVLDVEAVSRSLADLWKKTGLRDKKVIIGVANQKVIVRLVEFPYMEKDELKGAIQYQAQDYIPIPVEEAILDFQVVGEFVGENEARMMEVLLVAAQKDMIQNNVIAVENAGLKAEVIDVSSFAVIRSLLEVPPVVPAEGEEEAIALINIGAGITNIVVVEKGIPRFTRVTSLAGNTFTRALEESLGISFDEAEELKTKVGLSPLKGKKGGKKSAKEAERIKSAQEVLEGEIGKFAAEIRRSFDYYLSQRPQVKSIRRIVLSGGGAGMNNLASHLEANLQTTVELGHPLQKVQVSPGLSKEELEQEKLSLAICIGLALRRFEE